MSIRTAAVFGLALLAALLVLVPARAQQIHRHTFSNRQPALVRGDSNLQVTEDEHDISTLSFKSQPSSEHIKLTSDAGTTDSAYIHYFYETPPAPINELLTATVWVKGTKAGAQIRARVVFPKEPDPNRPEEPLTSVLLGDVYDEAKTWRKLTLTNAPELLAKHMPVLRTKVGHDVNPQGAYIDRIILNLYSGPGPLDIWIDDLDIGPVQPKPAASVIPAVGTRTTPSGTPTSIMRPGASTAKTRTVTQMSGQIFVDGKPYFMRAIRHSAGTPLYPLREAGFNTIWFPGNADPEALKVATDEGLMIVPTLPAINRLRLDTVSRQDEADRYAGLFQKFLANDSVLFWDIGSRYTNDKIEVVEETVKLVKSLPIAKRPVGADVWDDFQSYSQHLDVIGAHRWPLFTSLELLQYRDWLAQRRRLTATTKSVFYTWIQTHMPDWYTALLTGNAEVDKFEDPVGPQPEQIRLLTYLSVAVGARGLGFWSDRFLSDTHHGRDRLLGLALLNSELDMLAPLLTGTTGENSIEWVKTSHPNVEAAVLYRDKGILVLPMWLGAGSQYVPEQGALPSLTLTLKLVPESADPWLISPAGIKCLRTSTKKVPAGTELTIPDFDLVAPVVFTADLSEKGLVAKWQDYNRTHAKLAAQWALDLAAEEYWKVVPIHERLTKMGVEIREADALLKESRRLYSAAQKFHADGVHDKAHAIATSALRPLRILMRDHWQKAVATLGTPSASPYAVSFYTLPQHWELARQVQSGKTGANNLLGGDFELGGPAPKTGRRVEDMPGWSARAGAIGTDRVVMAAAVVPSQGLDDNRVPRKTSEVMVEPAYRILPLYKPGRKIVPSDEGYVPPGPAPGSNCLKLEVRPKLVTGRDGKPLENVPILEKTFLAADSAPVRLPPGTLVRISAWVKIPTPIASSPDGVLFYDDACGEPLSIRITRTCDPASLRLDPMLQRHNCWQHFQLYRHVPASGQIAATFALTGIGTVYVDDVRIEPLSKPQNPVVGSPSGVRQASGTTPKWLGAGETRTSLTPNGAPTVPTVPLP